MLSNRTVARPIGVRPTIIPRDTAKCSDHTLIRGLNTSTLLPVTGSMLERFGPLKHCSGHTHKQALKGRCATPPSAAWQ